MALLEAVADLASVLVSFAAVQASIDVATGDDKWDARIGGGRLNRGGCNWGGCGCE